MGKEEKEHYPIRVTRAQAEYIKKTLKGCRFVFDYCIKCYLYAIQNGKDGLAVLNTICNNIESVIDAAPWLKETERQALELETRSVYCEMAKDTQDVTNKILKLKRKAKSHPTYSIHNTDSNEQNIAILSKHSMRLGGLGTVITDKDVKPHGVLKKAIVSRDTKTGQFGVTIYYIKDKQKEDSK